MDFKNPYIILLAVPGFIALFAANFVSDFPQIRDSQLPFVYFLLSVISLGPPFLFIWCWAKWTGVRIEFSQIIRNGAFLLSTILFSLGVGLSVGILHTTDVISHSLRSAFGRDIIPKYSHDELVREIFSRLSSERFPDGRFTDDPNDSHGILPRKPFDANNRYVRVGIETMAVDHMKVQ